MTLYTSKGQDAGRGGKQFQISAMVKYWHHINYRERQTAEYTTDICGIDLNIISSNKSGLALGWNKKVLA